MRILLVNHGTAGEWGGGDGVQIRETAKRLAQRGHHVQAINADQPDARASIWYICSTAGLRDPSSSKWPVASRREFL